jgi:methionyl-tRNA formyltransferase
MRVVFMGTPAFALSALEALHKQHTVVAVYTQPPRPAGRGKAVQPSPVALWGQYQTIPVETPVSFRAPDVVKALKAYKPQAIVVAAYGLILPQKVLDVAPCLNIHASLLPRWRGAAPIERAIMAGDPETGVSIMMMEAGLDTGPVLHTVKVPITEKTTGGQLLDQLSKTGAKAIVYALDHLKTLTPVPQEATGVTYAAKVDKDTMRLDWSRPAAELLRVIRAFAPAPGAWTDYKGERIKILDAEVVNTFGRSGMLLDNQFLVACGEQALRPTLVQRSGKTVMKTADFLKGFPLVKGQVLAH